MGPILFFIKFHESPISIDLLEVDNFSIFLPIPKKRASCTPAGFKSVLELKFWQFFLQF